MIRLKHIKLFEQYNNVLWWYHGSQRDTIVFDKRDENTDYNMLGFGLYLTDIEEEAKYYVLSEVSNGYLYTISISNSANIIEYSEPIPKNIEDSMLREESFYDTFLDDEYVVDVEDYEYVDGEKTYSWDYFDNKDDYFIYDENKDDYVVKGLKEDEVIPYLKTLISGKRYLKEIEIDSWDFYSIGHDTNSDTLNKDDIFNSVYHLLQYLNHKYDSTKKASEYMVKHGIDGVTSNKDTTDIGKENGAVTLVCYNPNIYTIEKITPITK
jgi:hypothetical protein